MRVLVTGATGYIGAAVIDELVAAGHTVLGVARTDEGVAALAARGVEVRRGDLTEPEALAAGARSCDAVAHTAFIHDFSRFAENTEIERVAVAAMLDALEGSNKPFVISSGLLMMRPGGEPLGETDVGADFGRGATENMVAAAAARGVRTAAIRLRAQQGRPGLHPSPDRRRPPERRRGLHRRRRQPVAGVHRLDAARLYRPALEKGSPGARYHAVGDEGVPAREIAGAIGRHLNLPVVSLPAEQAGEHFGFLGMTYSGTTTSGVLTVTDGTHTASIHLIGNYATSMFTASSDGHGGAIVVDPTPAAPVSAPPHAFIAAMAALVSGSGGAVHAIAHTPHAPPMLLAPRIQIA